MELFYIVLPALEICTEFLPDSKDVLFCGVRSFLPMESRHDASAK